MPKSFRTSDLMEPSKEALHFWGKDIENSLPKPTITEDLQDLYASNILVDILQYARGAESRGELLFRKNYLHPFFKHFAATNTSEETTWEEDEMGNMYVQVGEVNGVLHVGHIDTVHADNHSPKQNIDIQGNIVSLKPVIKNSIASIKRGTRWVNNVDVKYDYIDYNLPPKVTRCLGADDGCAVAVMLYLIAHETPGTYVFTRGEEIGCVGTHYILDNNKLDWSKYMMAIEVDRKGTDEIINSMSVGSTASQSFVSSLAKALNMGHKAGKGTITDVGHMAEVIPECVNISAGYMLQHSDRETTNWEYLDRLSNALLEVNWEELVVERLAGQFTPPRPKTHIGSRKPATTSWNATGNNFSGNYTGRMVDCNSFGDYSEEPSTQTKTFNEMFIGSTTIAKEAFIRRNTGLLSELLSALNISPAQMENIIVFGDISGATSETAIEDEKV